MVPQIHGLIIILSPESFVISDHVPYKKQLKMLEKKTSEQKLQVSYMFIRIMMLNPWIPGTCRHYKP